jgi:hypothetical protein
MSSSATPPPGTGDGDKEDEKKDEKKGLPKRFKTIVGRVRKSISGIGSSERPLSVASDSGSKPSETPVVAKKEEKPAVKKEVTEDDERYKKARAIFIKHGEDLKPSEWPFPPYEPGERVKREPRMRVRRHCHQCQTTFGVDKKCSHCGHQRCKKCTRYPAQKGKGKGKAADKTAEETTAQKKVKGLYGLEMPSKTGGQNLVRKNIKQRIHRTCHKCDTHFEAGGTVCSNCQHTRCKKCPRDPAKLKKWPDGYPGDAESEVEKPRRVFRRPRRRVRVTCHTCGTFFKGKGVPCENCKHERCDECPRDPPKKKAKEPDPAVLQSLAQKLESVNLGASAA